MLKINLSTGTVWTQQIILEGTKNDDILSLIDQYFIDNNNDLPVFMYTLDDLIEIYGDDSNELESALCEMLPINGGEYYIEGIVSIEEIEEQ